jgi:antitoxin VapB
MSLNIKNEEAHKMAAELAAIRGVSMTAVVVDVLRRELETARRHRDADAKAADMIAWVKRNNKDKREDGLTSDHSWLYDDNGLPR